MTFTKTVTLPVTTEEAFALITQPERLRRWKTVTASIELRAGGEWRYTVTPGHYAAGTVHEIEPGKRLVLGWGWEDDDALPPDASTVTITVEPDGAGSKVTLVHEGLDTEHEVSHAEGWNHFLGRLEKLVATGDAGPDEWAWAPENLDPIVAAEAALSVLQPVLRALTNDDKTKPTPCADFTCHQLAEHLMGSITQLGAMAGGDVVRPEHGGLEHKVSTMAGQMIDAWRGFDQSGTVVGGDAPAAFIATIMPIELLLHTWDFAQATGQQVHVSDELVTYVAGLAEHVVPGGRENGSFGPAAEAGPDADALARLAAYAGRTPAVA